MWLEEKYLLLTVTASCVLKLFNFMQTSAVTEKKKGTNSYSIVLIFSKYQF